MMSFYYESPHEYAIFLSFSLIVSARANVGGPQFNNGTFCNQDLAIFYSLRHVIVKEAIRGIRVEMVSVDLRQQYDIPKRENLKANQNVTILM